MNLTEYAKGYRDGIECGESAACWRMANRINVLIHAMSEPLGTGDYRKWVILRMMSDVVRPYVQKDFWWTGPQKTN